MRLVIEGRDDLIRAQGLVSWLGRPFVDEIVLDLPPLDRDERRRLARKLVALFNDCGCSWGAAAFVLVLAASCWPRAAEPAAPWVTAGRSLMLALGGALSAKFAGLAWSRWRLKTLLARMGRAAER